MTARIFEGRHLLKACLVFSVAVILGCSDYRHWRETSPRPYVDELARDYRIQLPSLSDDRMVYHAAIHDVREGFVVVKVDGPVDVIGRIEEMIEPEKKHRHPKEDVTTTLENIGVSDHVNWFPRGHHIMARFYQLKPVGSESYKMSVFIFSGNGASSAIFHFSPSISPRASQ